MLLQVTLCKEKAFALFAPSPSLFCCLRRRSPVVSVLCAAATLYCAASGDFCLLSPPLFRFFFGNWQSFQGSDKCW